MLGSESGWSEVSIDILERDQTKGIEQRPLTEEEWRGRTFDLCED